MSALQSSRTRFVISMKTCWDFQTLVEITHILLKQPVNHLSYVREQMVNFAAFLCLYKILNEILSGSEI